MIAIVLSSVVSAVVCVGIYVLVTRFITKNTIRAQREAALKEAEAEGEMIKKERILQAKEKFIQLKSDYDRQVNERNQKLAQSEQRAKQIEANLLNQQRELENRLRENERLKEQMEAQRQLLEHKTEEIDRLMKEQNARLEQISGMSSEDAKNILIENMKAEAKSDAAAYINETIEEAKLTATKEAKRIIVTSIQRVATETAIENAVTVFNIESDEVKGRIIGREGRNIRALEAATGIEIIDDEPELPHAIIGMKLAEKYKEKPDVCNAIGAHHDEVEMTSIVAPIIQVCDAISGARPGARREVVESYIKRLKEMEEIALSYPGVQKTYAIQAGRELRVIVGADKLSDQESEGLSRDIAKKIQDEMTYPGQVKITVIRETRAVAYAK